MAPGGIVRTSNSDFLEVFQWAKTVSACKSAFQVDHFPRQLVELTERSGIYDVDTVNHNTLCLGVLVVNGVNLVGLL